MAAAALHSRVDGLHTAVEADDEVVQVEAEPQTVGHRDLFVETVKLEESPLLVGIVARVPAVARVDEGRPWIFQNK